MWRDILSANHAEVLTQIAHFRAALEQFETSLKQGNTPALQQLIQTALQNNLDLRVAALNIDAYRAQYRIQRAELLPAVGLDPALAGRWPHQLSGGQRQRVALARSLVVEPEILLLDEPLSALDAALKVRMQSVLKNLQRETGITFVYVTHSQSEAFSMADRVVIMSRGVIEQIGTPQEIYGAPRTRFVADFVGSSNVIAPAAMKALGGEARWTSLRPEAIRIVSEGGIEATVRSTSFLGASTKLFVETAVAALTISLPAGQAAPQTGESIRIVWSPADPHYMEAGA